MGHLQRGNKLWESHRIFLPEHKEALHERKQRLKIIEKPILDEDELEQLQFQLLESLHRKKQNRFSYYANGKIEIFDGEIKKIHSMERWLILDDGVEEKKVYLENIISIK